MREAEVKRKDSISLNIHGVLEVIRLIFTRWGILYRWSSCFIKGKLDERKNIHTVGAVSRESETDRSVQIEIESVYISVGVRTLRVGFATPSKGGPKGIRELICGIPDSQQTVNDECRPIHSSFAARRTATAPMKLLSIHYACLYCDISR